MSSNSGPRSPPSSGETETAFRAALTAAPEAPGASPGSSDGESAEIRALVAGVHIADYFTPAFGGRSVEGRAAELNAAFATPLHGGSGGPVVPWRLLRSEHRAFSTTGSYDGPTVQRPILQELFGPGIMDTLGVRIDDAGVGSTEYPLLTGGVLPVQTKEETAAGVAVAATFTVAALKPKRLTAKIEFTHEQAASVAGLEAAYKTNLVDALRSRMQVEILNGAAPTAQQPQRVEGFFTKIMAPANPSAVAAYSDYAGAHAVAVDGIHAEMETQVSSVIGDATYRHAATVYQAGSGESGQRGAGPALPDVRRELLRPGPGRRGSAGGDVPCGRTRGRRHARRQRGGDVGRGRGGHSRPLHAGEPRRGADRRCVVGCLHAASRRRIRARHLSGRVMKGEIERRFLAADIELREAGDGSPELSGVVVRYGDAATFGRCSEVIQPGALSLLPEGVLLNFNHDRKRPLARTPDTMTLTDSADAMRMSARLPKTTMADDALVLVRAKVIRGLSLEMIIAPGGERWDGLRRTITRARVIGIGVVDIPSYPGSELEMRWRAHAARSVPAWRPWL